MNRRSFFKLLGGVVAACAVPLPAIAQRGYRYAGTITGRWTSLAVGSPQSHFDPHGITSYPPPFRSVLKDVPIDVAQARRLRARDIRYQREEILGAREELKRQLDKLAQIRSDPLPTTDVIVVKVGPGDPDYGDWKKYAGDFEWINRQMERSPWRDLIEEKPFPSNAGSKLVRLT